MKAILKMWCGQLVIQTKFHLYITKYKATFWKKNFFLERESALQISA